MSVTPTPSDCAEDFDIYADLPAAEIDVTSETVADETLKEQIVALKAEVERLQSQNKTLDTANRNLSRNISVLFKTAKTEIERKDSTIAELRRELDNVVFRRQGKQSSKIRAASHKPESGQELRSKGRKCSLEAKGPSMPSGHVGEERNLEIGESAIPSEIKQDASEGIVEPVHQTKFDNEHVSLMQGITSSKSLNSGNGSLELATTSVDPKLSSLGGISNVRQSEHLKRNNKDEIEGKFGKEKKVSVWLRLGNRRNQGKTYQYDQSAQRDSSVSSEKVSFEGDSSRNAGEKSRLGKGHHSSENSSSCRNDAKNYIISSSDGNKGNDDFKSLERVMRSKEITANDLNDNSSTMISSLNDLECVPHRVVNLPENKISEDSVQKYMNGNPLPHCEKPCLEESFEAANIIPPKEEEHSTKLECLNKESATFEGNIEVIQSSNNGAGLNFNMESPSFSICPPLPNEEPTPLPPLPPDSPPLLPRIDTSMLITGCASSSGQEVVKITEPVSVEVKSGNGLQEYSEGSSHIHLQVPLGNCKPLEKQSLLKRTVISQSPHIQFPFKSRQRVKSMMVVETVDNESAACVVNKENITKEKTISMGDSTSTIQINNRNSLPVKSLVVCAKKAARRDDVPTDSRHFSDTRLSMSQRPAYSSRHLSSVKWSAHMPERRSPSEVLNEKSCRIELSHQDKIRIRVRDRRSRSLSPFRKNERHGRDGYYTRSRDSKQKNSHTISVKEDRSWSPRASKMPCQKKTDESMSTSKDKQMTRAEAKLKVQVEPPGEPSPEREYNIKKNAKNMVALGKFKPHISTETMIRDNSITMQNSVSSTLQFAKSKNAAAVKSEKSNAPTVIVIKRKSRAFVRLEDSEANARSLGSDFTGVGRDSTFSANQIKVDLQEPTQVLASARPTVVNQSHMDKCKSSPATSSQNIVKDSRKSNSHIESTSNSSSHCPNGTLVSDKSLPKVSEQVGVTPLYFRERTCEPDSRNNTSGDEEFMSESEESSGSDSDISYKPSVHKRRSKRKNDGPCSKKRAIDVL